MKSKDLNLSKAKKVWRRIVIAVLAGVIVLCVYFFGVWFLSDRIVKVSYTGLDNMFFVHDEYRAVAGPFQVRVPEDLAQTAVGSEISTIGDLDKETGRNFHVQVCWSENGRPSFEGTTTLIHSYDAKYVFEVRNPGPEKLEVTRDEERRMLEIAEHFYDFNEPYERGEDNWVARQGNFHTTIFDFSVYFNGDKTFFSIDNPNEKVELYSYENGHFMKVYTVPDRGDFDLVIWKGL